MTRKDPKGDVRTSIGGRGSTAVGAALNGGPLHRGHSLAEAEQDENRRRGCSALSHLLLRDDGWLRISPAGDGKTVYLKWKYSRGPWRNHYVMAVGHIWAWDIAIELLERKVAEVDQGSRVPTKDTWYPHGGAESPAE